MKTFKRSSLPDLIKYNNKIYVYSLDKTKDCIKIEVLSTRLKKATDIHGHPYKPSIHYFKPLEIAEFCSNCLVESNITKIMDVCPCCGEPLVACSLCNMKNCSNCINGSNFKL